MIQPLIFVGHGSPMNAIEKNTFTESWKKIGQGIRVPPRAILMFSAHWISEGVTKINTTEKPEMIYDMYGFPPDLYEVKYNCPGSKQIAEEIIDILSPEYSIIEDSLHGIDHGAWSVLVHLFPEANIPVIQMSLDYGKSPEWHYDFGKKLRLLREQGVLIIGSGNIVHNLREIDWSDTEKYQWAVDFDKRVEEALITRNDTMLLEFQKWGIMSIKAHPTYDHFLPIFPLLGASNAEDRVEFATPEITMGSLAMRSIVWRNN